MKRFCAKILSVVLILSCLFGSVACSPHEHVWGEWQTETVATCVAKGKEVRYCLDNPKHKEERETDFGGHTWGEWTVETAATCTTNGLEKRVCLNDATHVEEKIVQSLGHDWGEWEEVTPADCTSDGLQQRVCKNDQEHKQTKPITATNHNWGDWQEVTPATCSNVGEEERVCKNNAQHKETRTIEKAQCVWGEWEEVTPATCSNVGEEKRVCKNNAEHIETREISKKQCAWGDWQEVTPATCDKAGVERRICANVSSHIEERAIEPTGHTYGAWQQVTAPTASKDGVKKRVCTKDSTHVEEKVLRSLDGKSIIFIGNSYTYHGNTVNIRNSVSYPGLSGRTNDKRYFYQVCLSKGETVSVTNWTMDGHNLKDTLGSSCGASNKQCYGVNHYANLTDKSYDYVVFQAGSGDASTPAELVTAINKYMVDFKTANPNTKFVLLVQSQAHIKEYTWLPALKTLEKQGVIIVDWGNVVFDIMNGTTKVPNSTMTYNKNSFIIAKSASDGYHPNLLSGYITSLMTYCAITGNDAYGSDYSFCDNKSSTSALWNFETHYTTYYKVGTSNFREIMYSDTEMKGIQTIIDNYLDIKPYLNF